ncbi:MAG: polyphosphate polymerase domain-containing protein [Saprospiraceae bacterium]|nr:polyphosphate polymerase domain-containing protein [Saprospiraceae bacterium]
MRYELKYVCTDMDTEHCKQIIRTHPASFKVAFPDRKVNNVYLDTPDGQSYMQNLNGVSARTKYRIRWYGETHQTIRGAHLEFKIKRNHLGKKQHIALPDFKLEELTALLLKHQQAWQLPDHLRPNSINKYQRSYYIDFSKRFRITVDSDIQFGNFLGDRPLLDKGFPGTIIELKYDMASKAEADFIQQHLPWRRTKFSKYVEGLSRILN